jgi:hypothetical protein
MSTASRLPIGQLHAVLDEIGAVDPIYLTTSEKREALAELSRAEARLQATKLRVLAAADDIAEATGDRSTASWLANHTRDAHGAVRRQAALADVLDKRWVHAADAFAAGEVNLAQVRVIADALAALPKDLSDDLLAKAEALLVEEATKLGPRDLAILGGRVLERLAPDIAEEAEYQRLLAAERRASAATKLNMRCRRDGSTDIHARVPDHAAGRVRAYLNAFTAPRRRHLHDTGKQQMVDTPFGPLAPAEPDEFANLPLERQRGIAFVALLENIPTTSLPRHGGVATTIGVTLDYDTLVRATGTGVAETSTGAMVTAGVVRRWACQADILPVVLGGKSEILDVGREKRLVPPPIRKALNIRDKTCTATGCTMPAAICEAHHEVPWSKGGKTSLKDCKLLCPFHHHRAHDPCWITHHHPNGKTSFTRRQ